MLLLPNIYAFYYYKPTITRLFAVRIICVERERERERERESFQIRLLFPVFLFNHGF